MEKNKIFPMLIFAFIALAVVPGLQAQFVEPDIIDYENVPIYQTASVTPNIMVILDNSETMNRTAYPGSYGGGTNITFESRVSQAADDAEESSSGSVVLAHSGWDSFDLGDTNCTWAGIRFQNLAIPPGRKILSATLEFTSELADTGNAAQNKKRPTTAMEIYGQMTGSAAQFSSTANDVSGRTRTASSSAWKIPNTTDWIMGGTYKSADVSALVQEIVGDKSTSTVTAWAEGNSLAFLISCSTTPASQGKPPQNHRQAYCFDPSQPASTRAPRLTVTYAPESEDVPRYYGYFDPDARYKFDTSGNIFVKVPDSDPSAEWSGNWLNWATMRRIDVLRKVILGGYGNPRSGPDIKLLGETTTAPFFTDNSSTRTFIDTAGTLMDSKYQGLNAAITISAGKINVTTPSPHNDTYPIIIRKDKDIPDDFVDGEVSGVLQKVGDQARWGYVKFNKEDGGTLKEPMGSKIQDLVIAMQNVQGDTEATLSETLFVAMHNFMRESPPSPLDKCGFTTATDLQDPFYDKDSGQYIDCSKSFVILLTDGDASHDSDIPNSFQVHGDAATATNKLRDYDGDGSDGAIAADGGTNYLDDVALYAHTTDLRPDGEASPIGLDNTQNLTLYTIYAFGDPNDQPNYDNSRNLLMDAAKNGGFEDLDGDNFPSDPIEWDENADGVPDTFFEAQDGYRLERELINAIKSILERASSGTAVSVLATKGEGEGTLVQAYFEPSMSSGINKITWVGHLQSLWVDPLGNTREDSNQNRALELDDDNIIRYTTDPQTGDTVVEVYQVSSANPYPDNASSTKPLDEILSIWEAGNRLADTPASQRRIFTYAGGSKVDFTTANAGTLEPYFGVEDNASWGYLGQASGDRIDNLIHFIRGVDDNSIDYTGNPQFRQRTLDDGRLWKLSDIIHSTPVQVSKPVDNYGLIYDDDSYRDYLLKYKDRETGVFVGSNGGMLHCFTAGVYDPGNKMFLKISEVPGYTAGIPDTLGIGDVPLGSELWAYIPQNLLAHLKWLPDPDYPHVYYVDLKPKVVDAQIFADDSTHPNGWGTVLIGGMNLGGKEIATQNAGSFKPSYFAIDITNPRNPQILWEQTYANLGFTTNQPCVLKVGSSWFLALGSGPTDDRLGDSIQNGHVYIVDLSTGNMLRDFASAEIAFMNGPVAFDKGMNYNVDGIYVAANYFGATRWQGSLYKITVPQAGAPAKFDPQVKDYDNNTASWTWAKLYDSPGPITAPLTLSIDKRDNAWIYGGTGRYIAPADKTRADQNYFFGIKDPFFNLDYDGDCYRDYTAPCSSFDISTLFYADPYTIHAGGAQVDVGAGGVAGITTFAKLLEEVRKEDEYDGWYRTLCSGAVDSVGTCSAAGPSERVVTKPSILGGIVVMPTFAPNGSICGYGGNGRLFAVFYETGTAYKKRVIGDKDQAIIEDVVSLGEGLSSSFGVHVGKEDGGTIYGQLSTGQIMQINITPAFNPKSMPIYWREEQP